MLLLLSSKCTCAIIIHHILSSNVKKNPVCISIIRDLRRVIQSISLTSIHMCHNRWNTHTRNTHIFWRTSSWCRLLIILFYKMFHFKIILIKNSQLARKHIVCSRYKSCMFCVSALTIKSLYPERTIWDG